MKITKITKKLFVILTVALMSVFSFTAFASTDKTEIEVCVREYLEELIRIQESDNTTMVSAEQFESVSGYIIATQFLIDREGYKCISEEGIHDLKITSFHVLSIEEVGTQYEVTARVSYHYLFNGAVECNTSESYRVTVIQKNNKYKCVDVFTNNDDRVNEVMSELLHNGLSEKEDQIAYVNDRREQTYRDMYASMPKQKVYQTMDEVFSYPQEDNENPERSTNSTTVSYNTTRAATYASTYGGMSQNYIFRRSSLDCTNFVSQCVWAGYGGTTGFTLPEEPTPTNPTIVSLRSRVQNDYRMTSNWFGRNYYSANTNDPPVKWCGADEFNAYVATNSGDGPKATRYNHKKAASQLGNTSIAKGNVVQKYVTAEGRYTHSAMVVTNTAYTISDASSIIVAQHESDYSARPLWALMGYSNSTKICLLKFTSGTFSN